MKLLLDENLPRQLKHELSEHQAFTIQDMNWKGKSNGELLRLMIENDLGALLTADKNLKHQQNFVKYPIPVIVINVLRLNYERIKPLIPEIKRHLASPMVPGPIVIQ